MINYSVIIPHYNYGKKIKRLLDTIPDREDIEIIIVDDLSDENNLNDLLLTIKNQNKNNIKLLYNDLKNKGPGGTRNLGINFSSGKWLIFADCDDYFLENAFEEFDKNNNRDKDVIYFYMTSEDEKTKKISYRHLHFNENLKKCKNKMNKKRYKKYIIKNISPCGKLIKRKYMIENNIYFGKTLCGEDQIFSVKLVILTENIDVIQKEVYCILKRKGSITSFETKELQWEHLKSQIEIDKFLRETNSDKYRNYYILFLFRNLKYGRKNFLKIFKVIRKNGLKLFTKELFLKMLNLKKWYRFLFKNY